MGTQLPLPKKVAEHSPPPIFGPCLFWPNSWMDQDGTWHGGGPRSRPHCARWGLSSLSPKKWQSTPPLLIFGPCLLWPNGWIDQDGTWHRGGPRSRPHCARWGPSSPSPKGGGSPSPIIGPCLLWPNGWIDQHSTWHGGGPWSRPHCARFVPSCPLHKRGQIPQFSAHFFRGQTAVCIKMPLGTEIGLSPGEVVLDGVTAPPKRGTTPSFWFMFIVAKRLDG